MSSNGHPPVKRRLTPLDEAMRRLLGLPAPATRRITIERDLPVPMRDGVCLPADHYSPATDRGKSPTILIRTPYGRGGSNPRVARAVAAQGFHVVLQSCRGTAAGTGEFAPMRHERADGLDTIAWLADQPWYTGQLCVFGFSYCGYATWGFAADAGDQLVALMMAATAAQFTGSLYTGGAFSLDSALTWVWGLGALGSDPERQPTLIESWLRRSRLHAALAHLPLAEADRVATGQRVGFFQEWLAENDTAGEYWLERDHRSRVTDVQAPIHMIGGWYDVMLPCQLDDYAALCKAGRPPHLTIGPWKHNSSGFFRCLVSEAVAWYKANAEGRPVREHPVRVHIGGSNQWRDYPQWPPPGARPKPWYLHAGGGLHTTPAAWDGRDVFTYDPNDPTPALGGPRLAAAAAGRQDNRRLEARPDVRTYTSDPLDAVVEVLGPVTATVYVGASRDHFDIFVRLCDVDTSGRSWNVCDGLTRVSASAADTSGVRRVEVTLWPTAYHFKPGHRIRIQISGGAHPRFARNPGTGAALGEPSDLVPVRLEVHTSPLYESAIALSVAP
ncbi:CocE/NonD family hydrolase [Micromonospora sp. KC213]|uniref:CocE/NonD family hydrolase n=1 Tax=Micromonospora sp. KC213 TaxID=2530378 RepID=UPI0014043176|nr:CocE/NonD family hydrolase [Micromonospora sp. KC213]